VQRKKVGLLWKKVLLPGQDIDKVDKVGQNRMSIEDHSF
jgi:hypothetical protein